MEARRHARVKTVVPIRYYKLRDVSGVNVSTSITSNLGEGGIKFQSPEFVSMACRLILELDLPAYDKPVKAISKVAWIRKADSGDGYVIGNQFLEMSKEDRQLVADYVDNFGTYEDIESYLEQTEIVLEK